MQGLVETVSQSTSSVTPIPLQFTITADKGTQDGTLTAVKNWTIYGLVAWLVEHPQRSVHLIRPIGAQGTDV